MGSGANYQAQFHALLSLFATGVSNFGIFINEVIEDNHGDFTDVTVGFALWARHKGFRVNRNVIRNVAATSLFSGVGTDTNCYGILVYDTIGAGGNSFTCGVDGEIANNYILNPPSAGIYFAGAENINVHDNIIMGQYRTDETSLARAGISGNDLRRSKIHHNKMINCWGGIAVFNLYNSDVTEVSDNQIFGSTATDAFGIRIGVTSGALTPSSIALRRNLIKLTGATGTGIRQVGSDASNTFGSVVIEGNDIVSAYKAIALGGTFFAGKLLVKGNRYGGVLSGGGVSLNSISSLGVTIQDETFELSAATGVGLNVDATTLLDIADITFLQRGGSAVCLTAISAQGCIEGVRFRNVATALRVASTSLGYSIPTHTGTTGDFVQNVGDNVTEQGSAGSKYITRGWSCVSATTWRDHRELTGN